MLRRRGEGFLEGAVLERGLAPFAGLLAGWRDARFAGFFLTARFVILAMIVRIATSSLPS
jgi:hypothetical protein